MGRARARIALFVVPLTAWVVLTPAPAHAVPANLDVHVGAFLGAMPAASGADADGMRFYAPTLKVHIGDTITFHMDGFHTATLLPEGTDVNAWVEDQAQAANGPYSFIVSDPDDGGFKGNNAALFPSIDGAPAACGDVSTPCDAGANVVNSGIPFGPGVTFTVAMTNVTVGRSVWVLCLVHNNMRLRIQVVGVATAATTQAKIDAYTTATQRSDAEQAGALHEKLVSSRSKHVTANGTVVWDAFAGFDGPGFALDEMYPRKLIIHKGQRVRWHFDQLIYEDHTVTLPFKKAQAITNRSFVPLCDPDDTVGGDRVPADLPPPTFCSTGTVEFAIPNKFVLAQGDGVFRGRGDLSNSGVNGANIRKGRDPYTLKFAKVSSKRGFRYMCLIHGASMSGRIVVKPA